MRKVGFMTILVLLAMTAGHSSAPAPDWAMNATAIEACSCPHFCICYFNPHPATHHDASGKPEHYCKFNNAYKVNRGHYGKTNLDGAKFWITGDLGGDFSQGQMDWALVTFDKATTPEQRQALSELLGYVFPVKWRSFQTAEGNIAWTFDKDQAHATLNGGKTAEVKLKRFQGMTDEPAVLRNVRYWGTPRNDGFVMMPNEVEVYREGPKAFEFKGTNGFMLTFDMTSKDVAPKKGSSTGY
jgi:hypothetical protein